MKMSRMKHIIGILAWICLFTLVMSCSGKKEYDQLLEKADSIMNITDDSAKVAIQMLDGAKSQLPHFSKRQEMRYQLLYHKAMNKANIDFTSDSTMLEVVNYYENHGTANDRMLAYYVLGCVYRDLHEAPMALEYYNKATEQADTTDTNCDYATLCRAYYQMGVLFAKQFLSYQELSSLDKAVKYAYLAKDTLNAIIYFQNKQSAYASLNQKDSAIATNLKAAKLFRKYGYKRNADIAFGCNYIYYLERKEIEKAKLAFTAFDRAKHCGNSNYKDSYAYLLYEKGFLYLNIGKEDSAYILLKQSLQQSLSYSNKAAATRELAQYYSKTNKLDLSSKYALLSAAYNDSNLVEVRATQLGQMQAMYDYSRNEKLAEKARQEVQQHKQEIYMIILASSFVIIVLLSFFRNRNKKRNQKLAISQQLYNDSMSQLHSMKQELVQLQDMNEQKINKLIKEKETAIQKLQDIVKSYETPIMGQKLLEQERQIKATDIYKRFVYLENHPTTNVCQTDWINLEITLENLVIGFSSLKQKLNTKEYHICLLIKLKLSPSIISHMIGTSQSDITLSRQRMLQKVCGQIGKAKDFDQYIQKLF